MVYHLGKVFQANMEMVFSSVLLQTRCSRERSMKKAFGGLTPVLQHRLFELEAAETLADLPRHARCQPLTGEREGTYGLRLDGARVLVVAPNHNPLPTTDNGTIDPTRVKRIEVVNVVEVTDDCS